MDEYFPDSPRVRDSGFCVTTILTNEAARLSSRLAHLLHIDRVTLPIKLVAPPHFTADTRGSNLDQSHLLRVPADQRWAHC